MKGRWYDKNYYIINTKRFEIASFKVMMYDKQKLQLLEYKNKNIIDSTLIKSGENKFDLSLILNKNCETNKNILQDRIYLYEDRKKLNTRVIGILSIIIGTLTYITIKK
jgi:hypothetical protein